MKTKHTPGPWYRKPGANDAGAIHGADGRGVASVHYQEDSDRYEANARLIAAAPELRATLEWLADKVENRELHDRRIDDTSEARALLARIDGQEV